MNLVQSNGLLPTQAEWAIIKEQATVLVKSGLLPTAINTPEKAIAIALKGRELGVPMMHAFAHIHIVNGKPGISAELMLALIYKNCKGAVVNYLETNENKCVIEATRAGHKSVKFSFTMDEAQNAGLLNKDSWKKYPAAMLRARAVSIMARAVFPDATMGCGHTPEELGAEVNEDGEVIEIQSTEEPKVQAIEQPRKPKTRKEIGAEIVEIGSQLNLSNKEITDWLEEDFKVSKEKATIEQLEQFLVILQKELGRSEVLA